MAKALNFNTVKKTYFTVTLNDDAQTTLMIGTPTKAIIDDLIALQGSIANINEDETSQETTDDLYRACAKLMSRNKQSITITPDYLGEIFDFEDILIFFNAYMDFVSEITNLKN